MVPGVHDLDTTGKPAEEEIALQTVYNIIPTLRALLGVVNDLSEAWNTPANDVPGKIAAAYAAEATLAGYDPRCFDEWGQAFMAIMAAVNTPITMNSDGGSAGTAEKTVMDVLRTRYVAS